MDSGEILGEVGMDLKKLWEKSGRPSTDTDKLPSNLQKYQNGRVILMDFKKFLSENLVVKVFPLLVP